MKAAKLIAYAALGVIVGLLIENKTIRTRRTLEIKIARMRRRLRQKQA
jgi:hypothetical protein